MEKEYDVVIVGTGVAGLSAAINIPRKMNVLLITKDDLLKSNSYLAQGGISVLRDEDDFESYFEDTMRAGKYRNNSEAVEMMIKESREAVNMLIEAGVIFERKKEELCYTREGAHSKPRILHYQDITGEAITKALLSKVQKEPHITLSPHTTMIDWVVEEEFMQGIVIEQAGKIDYIKCNRVILATGGIGGVFENSTNFSHITGDSIALALKYGLKLKDMNYIQIHPTALYSKKSGRRFLITEAARGEGGILLNHKGERFVDELLPRDVVSTAIYEEMAKQHKPYVLLSFETIEQDKIKSHFPNIYERCLEEGYDIIRECIPVTPAQHYFMGGIEVDLSGRTSIRGLFAVGETSCNGVHGANRLASNSLLESVVFARRTADAACEYEIERKAWNRPEKCETYHLEELHDEYRQLVLEEIKRKDEKFYEQWCHNVNQCG